MKNEEIELLEKLGEVTEISEKTTITLYHAVTIENLNSIMSSGLIKNQADNSVYFTDDAVSSLNWIKWREHNLRGRNLSCLGLVIFEVDKNDPLLELSFDHHKSLNKEVDIEGSSYVYHKSIHPNNLLFEKCLIIDDEYSCEELQNNKKYIQPNMKMRMSIMREGFKNIIFINSLQSHYLAESDCINQFDLDPKKAYLAGVSYWKTHQFN